jgi:hypothetical protein
MHSVTVAAGQAPLALSVPMFRCPYLCYDAPPTACPSSTSTKGMCLLPSCATRRLHPILQVKQEHCVLCKMHAGLQASHPNQLGAHQQKPPHPQH